jgi:VWFA-related protein
MRLPISLLLASSLLFSATADAQRLGTNKPADQDTTYTMSVKSQLVVESVVVKDKSGNFVTGLTAKDFTSTEDGTPQALRFCEHETLPTTGEPLPASKPDDENVTLYKKLSHTQLSSEFSTDTGKGPADSRYKDHRLLVFYFDMTSMPPLDQQRALAAAEKFVRTQMTSADLISIMRFSGAGVDVLQDFTVDRNRLLSILETMVVGEGQGDADSIEDSASSDTGTAFGQDDNEFNIFNTDRQLSALQTAANMLGKMNEKKVLLYFASGMRLNGVNNQAQLRATIDAAIRMGVAFWPVDSRGLVAQAPLGDATQGSPGNVSMYNGTAAQAQTSRREQSQDTMYSLAADTGGKALLDNNDLTHGITEAQKSISDYYILGYYTTNGAPNGRFRKIKLTIDGHADYTLDYRQGYYAKKEFAKFDSADKDRQLEDALMLGDPMTELTIAMELNYFQLNRAEYYVPIMVKIPGRELALAKKFGADHTLIDFVTEIKDEVGDSTVSNVRDNVNIKLSDNTAAELAKSPISYDAGFTLTPGRYTIKFLARDDETGRIGTFQTSFVIPNLNKETRRVPISSVVLSSQQVDVKDALYNASSSKQSNKNDAVNPLVSNGSKIIPSVTRVFQSDHTLSIFLQAYAKGGTLPNVLNAASPPSPLVAFITLYLDSKKVYESKPIAANAIPDTRLGVTPISFEIPLAALAAGEYQCQVTVLDPAGQRANFWEGNLTIVTPIN